MQAIANSPGDKKAAPVLTKAVVRAAANLGITQANIAQILGVSAATVSRMSDASYFLAENRKEWELGALFVRMFRSLDAITGMQARAWLANENLALGDKPINLIRSAQGLVRVVEYLDASRARL
jgi:hypothetical protein